MKPTIKLHEGEKIVFECTPKRSLIAYVLFSKILCIMFVVFMVSMAVLEKVMDFFALTNNKVLFLLVPFFLLAFAVIWSMAFVYKNWYFFTNERCILYNGFFGFNLRIIPYRRIVDINLNRNPVRALLGFTAIRLDLQGHDSIGGP